METEATSSSCSAVSPSSTLQTTPTPTPISTPTLPHANLAAKQQRKSATNATPATTNPTTPAFLSNLGRATLRGIRKCPSCGVYNGTRGLSCKNKACGISLRNPSSPSSSSSSSTGGGGRSKKCTVEVVKVIIDSEKERDGGGGEGAGEGVVQVFSVSHRGRGGATGTQLGFVELVPTDTAIATGDGATLLTRINLGRCFLPSCRQGGQRSNQGGESESSKQSSDSLCVHIKQAIECRSRATPLTLKSSVLEGLRASVEAREELWRLATESPGPLVQRVNRDTLVVKCHADSLHPLGLLHLCVGAAGLSEAARGERRSREQQHQAVFHCACQAGGGSRRSKAGLVDGAGASTNSHHPLPVGSVSSPQPCLHFYACVCAFASEDKLASEFAAFINYNPSGVQQNVTCRVISPGEKGLQQTEVVNSHPKAKKLHMDESLSGSNQVVDERTVSMGFHRWLAGVTERIHQTMHYQFDGKPQPLVYHVPQEFFDALQLRLSLGSKKKRLPNFTTAFVSNDGLPLGSLSKYTWHITNLTQVKRIFDTPELPLETSQSFVKNVDGSYKRFHCPEPPPEPEATEGHRTDRPHAIRPMELRTFLKVGPGSADQKEAGPLVLEWTPGVLPRCQMGELRISFQFGHQRSGQPEHAERTGVTEGGGARDKSDSGQPTHAAAMELIRVVG